MARHSNASLIVAPRWVSRGKGRGEANRKQFRGERAQKDGSTNKRGAGRHKQTSVMNNTNTWTVKMSVMKGRMDVTEEKRHGQMVKGHHYQYSWGLMIFLLYQFTMLLWTV